MSARGQAGAQNNQQDESPFRKFIAIAQVRAYTIVTILRNRPLTASNYKANPPRLCSDTVR